MSIYIIHPTITPYRFTFFKKLSDLLNDELEIIFLSSSAKNRCWETSQDTGFKSRVESGIKFGFGLKDWNEININPKTIKWLFSLNKDDVVIVSGWLDITIQLAILLKPLIGYKLILWSGSTESEKSFLRRITKPYTKLLVSLADKYIAIGSKSKQYLQSLGANKKDISIAYNNIDTKHFNSYQNQTFVEGLKSKLSLKSNWQYILYVGQFIERKNVSTLIEAVSNLQQKGKKIGLILQGYGPLKQKLEEQVSSLGLHEVHFSDHIPYQHMPAIYNLADLLVVPSYEEVWGLVVNEAMASGLPVIVSSKCGAASDLVKSDKNGFTFQPDSISELADKVQEILTDKERMSKYSLKIIQNFTPTHAADNFHQTINSL